VNNALLDISENAQDMSCLCDVAYDIHRICARINRTFRQEFTLQNWGAAYERNIMSF
jgi:hypothetical protein